MSCDSRHSLISAVEFHSECAGRRPTKNKLRLASAQGILLPMRVSAAHRLCQPSRGQASDPQESAMRHPWYRVGKLNIEHDGPTRLVSQKTKRSKSPWKEIPLIAHSCDNSADEKREKLNAVEITTNLDTEAFTHTPGHIQLATLVQPHLRLFPR